MTDLEISKDLALKIGYLPEHVRTYGVGSVNFSNGEGVIQVFRHDGFYGVERIDCNYLWNIFDYRNWDVIGPIAQKYDCFPKEDMYGRWVAGVYPYAIFGTPQQAIALAVIGRKNDVATP